VFAELMATYLVLTKWRQSPAASKIELRVWPGWQQNERKERSRAVKVRSAEDEEIPAAKCAHHLHESARQRARELSEHSGVFLGTTTAKESRDFVRRTEKSHRTASLALTTNEVRSRCVF
jgi:hypothetical protein